MSDLAAQSWALIGLLKQFDLIRLQNFTSALTRMV